VRNPSCIALLALAVAVAGTVPAQAQEQFNPRDLTGIYTLRGHRSISANVPPMTPEGEARLNANKPTRGRFLGEPLNGDHPGFVRAVSIPAEGNDPAHNCNPNGFPRLLLDPEPVEFIHTEGRLLQLFQWERTLRELWMDGRPVPTGENLANLGPAWYGHTAGAWEGNTLVMNTVGVDDRAWIDIFGFPKSSEARFEERYTRTGPDTIELRLTMYDPKYYQKPWVSDVKVFRRLKREDSTYFGWYGLFSGATEQICAPMNEVDTYNTLFRDPAGKGAVK
jgi:hypothetical protein